MSAWPYGFHVGETVRVLFFSELVSTPYDQQVLVNSYLPAGSITANFLPSNESKYSIFAAWRRNMDRNSVALVIQAKSVAVAIILTLMFGGLGVFYVSILGGIIMSIITAIAWFITLVTFGFAGSILIPLVHGIALIWGIVGVNRRNKTLVL